MWSNKIGSSLGQVVKLQILREREGEILISGEQLSLKRSGGGKLTSEG